MEAYVLDWLSLLGRWLHLVTGIAWIGASFYFVWLDNHLEAPADPADVAKGVGGELWAVHGGGFYNPKKYLVSPGKLPATLHWFKWEAYWTWISGFFLLCLIYYVGADVYLIDKSVADIGSWTAIGIGLSSLVLGWVVYDRLCASPLGARSRALAAMLTLFLVAAAWGLCHVFSGRGAFIHFGAMLGTIMVANVAMVIMPAQRELVAACRDDREPDPSAGARAKQRSVHNTYFTLPVVFTMISNHYAMAYSHPWNWAILLAIAFAGAAIRTWFVARHKGDASSRPLIAALLVLCVVAAAIAPKLPSPRPSPKGEGEERSPKGEGEFSRVTAIVKERCTVCHSTAPTQAGFSAPPKGVIFDTPEQIAGQSARILQQTSTRAMPIGNLTGMTDAERSAIAEWVAHGAPRMP
jgi:uncharacterized membrane protein